MATILLIIIYVAFIGLGIPDSLFGTAWPAIYMELGLPVSSAGFVTVFISAGTIVSSVAASKLIARFGTAGISAFSTAMTAAALLGFSFSGSLWFLCMFAVPLGLGAGAIDTALNNYVSLHYSAAHMSFLHCFYGVGVSFSPYVMSLVISGESGWRGGYRLAFGMQIGIALILFAALPVWKKAHGHAEGGEERKNSVKLGDVVRLPGVKTMWCLFITSCAIEYTGGGWGSTFLVEYKHVEAEQAARIIMFYYMGMALGRFLSGILAVRLDSWRIIKTGQCVLGIGVIVLLLPLSFHVAGIALFMVGLGNGPLFPNFNYLTPQNFGHDVSQTVMGTQMAASYAGIMLAPVLCGILAQFVGLGIFPIYLLVLYLGMLIATWKVKSILNVK